VEEDRFAVRLRAGARAGAGARPDAERVRGSRARAAALVWSLVALSLPANAQQNYRAIRPTSSTETWTASRGRP
jgi:hypothetical protein